MSQQRAEETPISEVMHPHPYCVTAQASVGELVSLFLDNGISAAPVVDDTGKPIRFVSKIDVVREIREGYRANRSNKKGALSRRKGPFSRVLRRPLPGSSAG